MTFPNDMTALEQSLLDSAGYRVEETPALAAPTAPAGDSEETQHSDPINPGHYQDFSRGAQVIDITENLNFNGGNAVKYLARSTRLDGRNKGKVLEDLKKARWYVEREVERVSGEVPGEDLKESMGMVATQLSNTFTAISEAFREAFKGGLVPVEDTEGTDSNAAATDTHNQGTDSDTVTDPAVPSKAPAEDGLVDIAQEPLTAVTAHRRPPRSPQFTSEMGVFVVQRHGEEKDIVNAARVSTGGKQAKTMTDKDKGLVRRLAKDGHGTPFEYPGYVWGLQVPIFVSRQVVKYRLTTINEVSGRYSILSPWFYLPHPYRPMFQLGGSPMDYSLAPSESHNAHQKAAVEHFRKTLQDANLAWWESYLTALKQGIAKEVARMGTPTNLMISLQVKMNLRQTLHFISQRVYLPQSARPSHGQWEIDQVARAMAHQVARDFPTVWEAFVKGGYRSI